MAVHKYWLGRLSLGAGQADSLPCAVLSLELFHGAQLGRDLERQLGRRDLPGGGKEARDPFWHTEAH